MRLAFAMSFLAWLALVQPSAAVPTTDSDNVAARFQSNSCGPDYCKGTNNTDPKYFCGDARLGPAILPTHLPLGTLLASYDRLGGLCPGEFIAKWYNAQTHSYIYPPDAGYQLNTASRPIQGNQTLMTGMMLDRFGSEFGSFLSPAGAPYNQRALPPSNLDTPESDPRYPYNYHVYRVVEPFVVLSGPIAPWFGQPGQGTQYMTYSNIMALLTDGYLEPVNIRDEN